MTGSTRVHAIFGMHRSGTSWLAGTLQEMGLPLGAVNEAAPANEKGTRENPRLRALHDAVLAESGGSWRDPVHPCWSEHRRAELRTLIEEMNAAYDRWGFKDPRALFVLDEWERQVPEGLKRVGVFRHPEAVVRSLQERSFAPVRPREGRRLWLAYNTRLVEEHQREPFPLLRFDAVQAGLLSAVHDLGAEWGLPEYGRAGSFYDAGLVRSGVGEHSRVPRSCRAVWEYLVAHARNA